MRVPPLPLRYSVPYKPRGETRPDRVVTAAKTASPAAMTQHSDASSDRSEVSVTPPPPVSKVLEFASHGLFDLEHRNVLAAPLAALHSMTEMRVQDQLHRPTHHHQQEKTDADALLERTSLHVERSGLTSRSPGNSSQGANPHGIDHILSRPTQVQTNKHSLVQKLWCISWATFC